MHGRYSFFLLSHLASEQPKEKRPRYGSRYGSRSSSEVIEVSSDVEVLPFYTQGNTQPVAGRSKRMF